ncbi:MAG: thiamine phosphate synthase [Sphingobacteriaceae bacterium]
MDRLIVISSPDFFIGEAKMLNQLFESGLTRFHLRKPESRKEELRGLLSEIDFNYRKRITMHYHLDLVTEMELGGMHFSYPQIKNQVKSNNAYSVSCSLHKWDELFEVRQTIDYCFMSPVFNSISKSGYQANEALNKVPAFAENVYALGGITANNCKTALDMGYSGIAILGYLWEDKNQVLQRFALLQEKLSVYE